VKFEKFKEDFSEEIFIAEEKFVENFNNRRSETKTEIKSIDLDNWAY
jgi:hypothetical protein